LRYSERLVLPEAPRRVHMCACRAPAPGGDALQRNTSRVAAEGAERKAQIAPYSQGRKPAALRVEVVEREETQARQARFRISRFRHGRDRRLDADLRIG